MKEIKTVALVGLGAIGAYFADRLQPMLGDDLRVIAGGARAERIRREGLVINGKQEYYHVVEPGEGEPADLVIFATKMSGLQQAIEDVRAQIGPETLILSPLNGVESEEVVAKTYGWENIVYSLMRISSSVNVQSVSRAAAPSVAQIVPSSVMKTASKSDEARQNSVARSSPMTNRAVESPSASVPLSARIVTERSPFCTGLPVCGSRM